MKKVFIILLGCLLFSCATSRLAMQQQGDRITAIENAIEDFLVSKYSKGHQIFSLYFEPVNASNNVIAFSIFENDSYKLPVTEIDTIGSTRLPTRHLIKDGKLFYWRDSDYGMTEEFLNAVAQFDCIDTVAYRDLGGRYFKPSDINEKEKSVHYYFCKGDLTKYKRVFSNGWHKPPKLKCK